MSASNVMDVHQTCLSVSIRSRSSQPALIQSPPQGVGPLVLSSVPTQGPVGRVANAPNVEDTGTEYSDDGARDLSGSPSLERELILEPHTSQAAKRKPRPREPKRRSSGSRGDRSRSSSLTGPSKEEEIKKSK